MNQQNMIQQGPNLNEVCNGGLFGVIFIFILIYLSYRSSLVSDPNSEIIASITRTEKAVNQLINEFKIFKMDYMHAIKSNNLKENCVCNIDEPIYTETFLTNINSFLENNSYIVGVVLSALYIIVLLECLNLLNHSNLYALYQKCLINIHFLYTNLEPYKPHIVLITFILFVSTFTGYGFSNL